LDLIGIRLVWIGRRLHNFIRRQPIRRKYEREPQRKIDRIAAYAAAK
jgi:hypothetical protein